MSIGSRYFVITRDADQSTPNSWVSQYDTLEDAHERAEELRMTGEAYTIVGVENYCEDGPYPITSYFERG